MLVQAREWQWNRYLKHALNLPDWIDLVLENRTRHEVYDHPWRTTNPQGERILRFNNGPVCDLA
jgi:hypothetical protein